MPGGPHFCFDRSVTLPILYLLTKKQRKSKKDCVSFPQHRTLKNVGHRGHPDFAEKGFGRFLAGKKVFDCNNLLNGSIKIYVHHGVFLPVVERRSFFLQK